MKWRTLLLLPVLVAPACGPGGDGDVLSCSCDIGYVAGTDIILTGTTQISLCETDLTKDHTAEAETECVAAADKVDTRDMHQCACTCVKLVERCDSK